MPEIVAPDGMPAALPPSAAEGTPPSAGALQDQGGSSWRTLLIIFTLAGVVESQAFGHLNAFRPLFLQQLGVPAARIPFWTGLLASLGFMIGLPLIPFWGVWADRYSRKLIIARSAYVEGILFSVAAFSPNVWFLAVAQLLGGFVYGNTGVMLAMLADVTPRRRLGLVVGIASAGFPIGASVGPLIGGWVVQTFGIRQLLFGDAVASALMGLALTLIVREPARIRKSTERVGVLLRHAVNDIVASRLVLGVFGLYFLTTVSVSLTQQFLPILLQRLYTGSPHDLPSTIGVTLSAAGIAMAITTPLWGRVGDWVGRWRTLPVILAALTLGLAAEGLAPRLLPLQGAVLWIGLFQGGVGATIVALLALLAPAERRASILTFSLLPSQFSWFLGPLVGAGLASVALRLPFAGATLLQVGACALAVWLGRVSRAAGASGAESAE